jgi:hypothetical protein
LTRTLLLDVRLRIESSGDVLFGVTRPSAITGRTAGRPRRACQACSQRQALQDPVPKEKRMASVPFNYFSNIFIHNNPVAYRREVARYLDLIRTTESGRTLIKFIMMSGRKLLIKPYHPTYGHPTNAFAHPDIPLAAYPKGAPVMREDTVGIIGAVLGVNPDLSVMVPTGDVGIGGGSPVTITYHPTPYREFIKRKGRIDPGDGPGEVLFHEMVHAMRQMFGKYIHATVVEDLYMDNFEEFCAVVAANIYRQERGFTSLRSDHLGHVSLGTIKSERYLVDSDAYYEKYRPSIDKWFASQGGFCLELARCKVKFNPLREAAIAKGLMQPPPVSMRLP